MDKTAKPAASLDWALIPLLMPGIKPQLEAKRAIWGKDWVDQCWHRGVVLGEPGWFFARQGPVWLGTASPDWVDSFGALDGHPSACVVDVRAKA